MPPAISCLDEHALPQRRPAGASQRRAAAAGTHAGESRLLIAPQHGLATARLCGAQAWARPPGAPAGGWLLRAACLEAQAWRLRCRRPALAVTVALPPHSAHHGTLLAQAEAALRISGLPGGLLDVAFDEADLTDAGPDMLLLTAALRDLGAGVALDSQACGAKALRTLRRLPVTALRLPPWLVRDVASSGQARTLAHRAIRVAHALGASAVALGVDSAVQRDILADLGCDAAQGSLFGTVAAADFLAALGA